MAVGRLNNFIVGLKWCFKTEMLTQIHIKMSYKICKNIIVELKSVTAIYNFQEAIKHNTTVAPSE